MLVLMVAVVMLVWVVMGLVGGVVAAVPFPLVDPAVPSQSIPIWIITFSPLSPFPVSVSVSGFPFSFSFPVVYVRP